MKATDNAAWLLTIAVREHTRNMLKGSIAHKKAAEKGKILPMFLHYPNPLASTGKKESKPRSETTVAPSMPSGGKRRIDGLDVLGASLRLPSGQVGSLGGSISRISVEQSFQSAFSSIPPFWPGRDFKDVQNFITEEIIAMSDTFAQDSPKQTDELSSNTQPSEPKASIEEDGQVSHTYGNKTQESQPISSISEPTSTVRQPLVSGRENPKAESSGNILSLKDSNPEQMTASGPEMERAAANENPDAPSDSKQDLDDNVSPGVSTEIPKQSQQEVNKATDSENGKTMAQHPPQQPRPFPGAGRGAKNLRALMARAAETKREETLTTASTTGEGAGSAEESGDQLKSGRGTEGPKSVVNAGTAKEPEGNQQALGIAPGNPAANHPADDVSKMKVEPVKDTTGSTGDIAKNEEKFEHSNLDATKGGEISQAEVSKAGDDAEHGSAESNARISRPGRGKGCGTKDLAAMRARSMGKPEDES
mmetsp:Transcript_9921/g.17727  ORF Transcript_9921/g.17727 Transcript_9921/m.17727 type:complete len:478 (+) Transcript_9921:2-1435(+)